MMRKIMINTICKNYLKAHRISEEDEETTRQLLEQLPSELLYSTLIESHMINPLNCEEHEIGYIGEN